MMRAMPEDPGVRPFDADVAARGGYVYTTHARLSSQLANRRLTDAAMSVARFRDRSVIDIGCGDGTYTLELVDRGGARQVVGVDPAAEAVRVARERIGDRPIAISEAGAYDLPHPADSFEVAHLRGVLHHVERPRDALAEALRVAPEVVVIEPNGYNLGLKLLERVSPYHREHGERSYMPRTLDRWVRELGARVAERTFAGLVPMFSPDRLARGMKRLEPALEAVPGLRDAGCAVYVFRAERAPRPR
jgi:ubiquinone/menaquinone biosynthesis C-methylase UbiE